MSATLETIMMLHNPLLNFTSHHTTFSESQRERELAKIFWIYFLDTTLACFLSERRERFAEYPGWVKKRGAVGEGKARFPRRDLAIYTYLYVFGVSFSRLAASKVQDGQTTRLSRCSGLLLSGSSIDLE
jgi:hypothetical protein